MKKILTFYVLAGALFLSVCACTKDDDGGKDQPSVLDTKIWPYDEGLNEDIAPGDDFYSYVTAGRADNWENVPFEHVDDLVQEAKEAINNDATNPYIKAVGALTGDNYNEENEKDYLCAEYARIDALREDELGRELLLSAVNGTSKLFYIGQYFNSRKACVYFDNNSADAITYLDYDNGILGGIVTENEYESFCNTALRYISSGSDYESSRIIRDEILGDIPLNLPCIPVTKSGEISDEHAAIAISVLGTKDLSFCLFPETIEAILNIADQNPDDARAILKADLLSTAVDYFKSRNHPWDVVQKSRVWRAHASKKFAEEKVSDAAVEYAREMSEKFRTAFSQRLNNLDWMSPSTKTRAQSKLQSMHFFFGRVNGSYDDFIPQLEAGYTSIEQMQSDLEAKMAKMFLSIIGQDLSDDVLMWYIIIGRHMLFEDNAFYNPACNAMILLPSNIVQPLTDVSRSDAYNYATLGATTIGHEMCHGFDATGSQYNEKGDLEDWWTLSDKLLFKEKQNQINTIFENYTVAGRNLDGEEKLGENMADFGGICVGLTALKNLRESQGYDEAGLRESLRRYLISYAIAWNTTDDVETQCKKTEGDSHSPNILRVNSNVNQLDEWYDIFDVQWGARNYLTPEQRVKLW